MNKHLEKKLKEIKKTLISGIGYIRLTRHTKKGDNARMRKRGYTNSDIISAIMTGKIVEMQKGYHTIFKKNNFIYVLEGKDTDSNPIVVVFAEDDKYQFAVITVMPALDKKRFTTCIS